MSDIRFALPKGRIQKGVVQLLDDAGIAVRAPERGYRPVVEWRDCTAKIFKPQTVVEMLARGSRDLGFAGADWVAELGAELVCVLDTGLDPVQLVAAAPQGELPAGRITIASEYERITRSWIDRKGLSARFVRSYGATEVLPPEDADCIVDNTATGATLRANRLEIIDTLMTSSTRLFASPQALRDATKRRAIDELVLLLKGVLDARERVLVELNVPADAVDAVVAALPALRRPTVARLAGEGFAVKAAVPRRALATLIPALKEGGGRDVVVSRIEQVIV
ncbi:MAG: ATP phosphoribosyltransferase [Planctomycetota bacterium]